MSENYIQIPPNSTGSKIRTIQRTIGANEVDIETFTIVDSGSGETLTPARTEQLPTALTADGSLKIAVVEGMSGSASVGITGSSVLNTQTRLTGSDITLAVSGSLTSIGAVNITGSVGQSLTGSIGLSITGSSTITTSLLGTAISGSVGITGSSTLPVSLVGTAISGSVGITGSSALTVSSVPGINVTGSIGVSITGSSTLTTNVVQIPGINITGSNIPFSGVVSGSVGITGSASLPVTLVGTAISGSIGITGSQFSQVAITGSIGLNITGSNVTQITGINITGSNIPFSGVTSGSVGITGSVTLTVQGSIGTSGSVDLTTTGSILLAPNNAGILLFPSGSDLKVKVYSAGYSSPLTVYHCLYFGNTTTRTANAFLVTSGSGTFRQTFVQPVVSAASQGLYIWSSGSESNMAADVEYALQV